MGKSLKGKELGKGIRQKCDGYYEARCMIQGKSICIREANLNELKRKFNEAKRAVNGNMDLRANTITLNQWFEEWFETYKKPFLKKSTAIASVGRFARTFGDNIGDRKLAVLTNKDIQRVINDEISNGRASYNMRAIVGMLRACLESAKNNLLIRTNPAMELGLPQGRGTKLKEKRFLTTEEQQIFLEYAKQSWFYEMLYVMFYSGLRVGEVGGLRREDIDFHNKEIRVERTLRVMYSEGEKILCMESPKTLNSYRTIPFMGNTELILQQQLEKVNKLKQKLGKRWRIPEELGDLVFVTSLGSPVIRHIAEKTINKIVDDINAMENILSVQNNAAPIVFEKVHPHSIRHTFCSRCFETGINPKVVQTIMGHASYATTMNVYTHVTKSMIKQETEKMDI